MRKEYVLNKITQLTKEKDWTLYRLAKEAGMEDSALRNLYSRSALPSIPTLIQICKGLGITLSEFFYEGSTTVDHLTKSDLQLITNYHNLKRSDKKLVYDYIQDLLKRVPNAENAARISSDTDGQSS